MREETVVVAEELARVYNRRRSQAREGGGDSRHLRGSVSSRASDNYTLDPRETRVSLESSLRFDRVGVDRRLIDSPLFMEIYFFVFFLFSNKYSIKLYYIVMSLIGL